MMWLERDGCILKLWHRKNLKNEFQLTCEDVRAAPQLSGTFLNWFSPLNTPLFLLCGSQQVSQPGNGGQALASVDCQGREEALRVRGGSGKEGLLAETVIGIYFFWRLPQLPVALSWDPL